MYNFEVEEEKQVFYFSFLSVALIYQHCSFWIYGNVCSKTILLFETVLHTETVFLSINQQEG